MCAQNKRQPKTFSSPPRST